jgi:hypothetical protein
VSSLKLKAGPLYYGRLTDWFAAQRVGGDVTDEEAILDEAMDNLMEAAQRIRATQNRLWSVGLDDHPNYRNLCHRVSSALAMTEAAFFEARRRSDRGSSK